VANLTASSSSAEADIDLQQNVNVYLGTLGENAPFVRLLKAGCSQGIVAPVWTWLKMFLLSGHPFKDVKLGWLIYIVFDGQLIHIVHQKREQSNHDEEDPPRAPGEFDFEFTWELRMTFDIDMEKMTATSFGLSAFNTTNFCDSSLAKKLDKKVKGWRIESFIIAELALIDRVKKSNLASPLKAPSMTFAPSTYEEFRKAVQKDSGPSSPDRTERDSPGPSRSKSRSSPRKSEDQRRRSVVIEEVKAFSQPDMKPASMAMPGPEQPPSSDKDRSDDKLMDSQKRSKSPGKRRKSSDGKI